MNNDKSIEFVKRFLIPFVNAKSDKEKLESFENIAKDGITFLMDRPKLKIVIADNANLKLVSEKINQTHEIILKMLRIALVDGEFEKLYPEKINNYNADYWELTDLEKYIVETLEENYKEFIQYWRGKGLTFPMFQNHKIGNIYSFIEEKLIRLLILLFESSGTITKDKNEPDTYTAIGYKYFAICPKCGKFFYKKRKDMIFDSEKCSNAEHQKRHRKRNNTD